MQSCPYEQPNCVNTCSDLEKYPCQTIDPLQDATFWSQRLQPGQRSPLYRSNLRILDLYDDAQRVYFCYVHVGAEIARIEVPAWVAEDRELFDRSLSIMLGQVHKGYGYPVALAESHNQTVVRSGGHYRFFASIEHQLVRAGIQNVGTSYKEARKMSLEHQS